MGFIVRAATLLAVAGAAGCEENYNSSAAMPAALSPSVTARSFAPARLVRHPGTILFPVAARQAALRALPFAEREALCGSPEESWGSHPVIRTMEPRDDGGPDESSQPYALTVMEEAAVGFGLDDARARTALIRLLDRWARGSAMTRFDAAEPNLYYAIDRSLLPTLIGFSLVQSAPEMEPERRERITAWLSRLVEARGPERRADHAGDITSRNNHHYLSASVSMAWGALAGDDDLFSEGIDAFDMALEDMRQDGSLPLETERGARALWYQRHAIASLVGIAEMAALQGIDLYGREQDGRSLHAAIRFLLDGIDDPALVRRYAESNYKPGPDSDTLDQDVSFLKRRGHGRHYMAWAEIYLARFPEREESRRLLALLEREDPDFRPMQDDYSGGNTTCFFAPP